MLQTIYNGSYLKSVHHINKFKSYTWCAKVQRSIINVIKKMKINNKIGFNYAYYSSLFLTLLGYSVLIQFYFKLPLSVNRVILFHHGVAILSKQILAFHFPATVINVVPWQQRHHKSAVNVQNDRPADRRIILIKFFDYVNRSCRIFRMNNVEVSIFI